MKNKILVFLMVLFLGAGVSIEKSDKVREVVAGGFSSMRGFATLDATITNDISYDFGVVDIPLERPGAASSSTGFEFGKFMATSATAFSVASTSNGFAVTMRGSGRIKACSFDLQTSPNTGTVSIQIQVNETLYSGKYCKLPSTGSFATAGGPNQMSRTEAVGAADIPFVAGDRIGIIASSSNLNAATVDGWAKLIIQLDN